MRRGGGGDRGLHNDNGKVVIVVVVSGLYCIWLGGGKYEVTGWILPLAVTLAVVVRVTRKI